MPRAIQTAVIFANSLYIDPMTIRKSKNLEKYGLNPHTLQDMSAFLLDLLGEPPEDSDKNFLLVTHMPLIQTVEHSHTGQHANSVEFCGLAEYTGAWNPKLGDRYN
jgi:hypothetical protein